MVADLRERFPALQADDVDARISDFTFDIGERMRVPQDVIEQARAFARSQGARTTRSSMHLPVTFDGDDKAPGAVHLLSQLSRIKH